MPWHAKKKFRPKAWMLRHAPLYAVAYEEKCWKIKIGRNEDVAACFTQCCGIRKATRFLSFGWDLGDVACFTQCRKKDVKLGIKEYRKKALCRGMHTCILRHSFWQKRQYRDMRDRIPRHAHSKISDNKQDVAAYSYQCQDMRRRSLDPKLGCRGMPLFMPQHMKKNVEK